MARCCQGKAGCKLLGRLCALPCPATPQCLVPHQPRRACARARAAGAYWRVLSEAGISRQRLESFDRPIVCEPEYFPDKRDALIRDMNNYLTILKSVSVGVAGVRRVGGWTPPISSRWVWGVNTHGACKAPRQARSASAG